MAMHILEQLKWRYATKKFDETRKVSSDTIETLKEAFNLTASSYGLQPLKLILVSNHKVIKDLVPLSFNQGQVASASHIFILCVENNVDTAFIKNYFDLVEKTRTTPRELLRSFEEFLIDDFSKKTSEEIKSWATNQAYLAIGNLLTVCAIEKVDACPIEGFAPDKYDAYFNLSEKGLSAVLVMAVGHRAKDDVFSEFKKVRRGVDALVIEIE